ncbi:MAG: 6-pyruvoyl-tetrahydropterin synthase-related protein [Actinobacteria bacterium]|nr:6-pyruvoyl-tetrahydropterin synthase-related protein [Actinomycetota bacterium]
MRGSLSDRWESGRERDRETEVLPIKLYRGRAGINERRWIEQLVSMLTLVSTTLILFYFFRPDLLLSTTTTTGGDTGAHHYIPLFLKNYLLPRGRITGWAPGWYAGFPALTFYFPLPALLIAALSYLIPYQIAFKLVTVAGSFMLPLAAFATFKMLDFDFPMPEAAALMSIPFLLMESFTINGANLLSTLAGEFGYSIAFALVLPLTALFYRTMANGRSIVAGAFTLAATVLSHAVPAIIAVASILPSVIGRNAHLRLWRLLLILSLGFALSAFWSLPFIAKLGYAARMVWQQTSDLENIIPREIRMVALAGALGLVGAILKRERRLAPFMSLALLSLLLYFYLPDGPIWRGRFLPFWYYAIMIFAAYAISLLARTLAGFARRIGLFPTIASALVLSMAGWTMVLPPIREARLARSWIEWNYSGYERKPAWQLYRRINDKLKSLPPGRVMWEYSPAYGKFGTPRAFEIIPYWTGKPTMEGTLIESSLTAPFHFINQAEISPKPTRAVPGITYPDFSFEMGVKHLELYNIKYLLVTSEEARAAADSSKQLKLLKRTGEFSIYEVATDGYVSIPKYRPLKGKERFWHETSLSWYKDEDKLDVPIVFGSDRALSAFKEVGPDLKHFSKTPLSIKGGVSEISLSNEELKFKTSAIGLPHLVRISYFPNWKAEGAYGPYLVTPSIMMVIPRENEVRLYYGKTLADYVGVGLTIAGLLACLILVLRRPARTSKYRRSITFLPPRNLRLESEKDGKYL